MVFGRNQSNTVTALSCSIISTITNKQLIQTLFELSADVSLLKRSAGLKDLNKQYTLLKSELL